MYAAGMPLAGPPPTEVPLAYAPLVRVVTQVRFPLIASIETREFIAPFQEAIRREYPVLRPEQSRALVIGSEGNVVDARSSTIWRFQGVSEDWRVSLAPDFLALETTKYTSRDDFLGRFERVLAALREYVDPQVIDRLGIRYIDRVLGDNLDDLPQLVRPEVAGVMATPLATHVDRSVSETVLDLPESGARLLARWGLLPPRTTVDPAAVDAVDQRSWLLDLDAFLVKTSAFDVGAVLAQTRGLAERAYAFFRWVVTDEFLRRYGGEP